MKLILKQSIKKVKGSLGRFFSLFFIVLLGVGFFAGIKSARYDMYLTGDKYYDDYKLMDIKITSTLGLTNDDIKEVSKIDSIEEVIGTYSIDAFLDKEVIRVHALNEKVNLPWIKEGRMPQSDDECLAEEGKYKIGDEINLSLDNIEDSLKNTSYKVVGLIRSPMYIGLEKGITNIGSGKLESYIYINESNFKLEAYTELYLKVKNATSLISYEDEYERKINQATNELSKIKPVMETRRYEEIQEQVNNEIEKVETELKIEREKGIRELTSAKEKLDENKSKLETAKKRLATSQKELEVNKISGLEKINNAKKELETGKATYQQKLTEYNNTKEATEKLINETKLYLEQQKLELENNKDNMPLEEYNKKLETLNKQEEELKKKEQQFLNAPIELENTKKLLAETETKINTEEKTYYSEIGKANNKIEEAKQEIITGEAALEAGYKDYEAANTSFENKIQEAYDKIEAQKQELEKMPKPKWYVLDRTDNPGYTDFKNDALRVDAIASVFPVFFLLVAALVCLNTMTRMVEEERGEIGIYKALGYNNFKIISSYLIYVLVATLFGSVIGLLIGYNVLPRVIFGVYSFTYYLPNIIIYIDPLMFTLITLVAILLILSVTVFSCCQELKEQPASLLRPKPPKKGKKIFLEKIKWIWKHISFTGKVTIRNLFRYKKRIFMTIIGIAGCTALTLTGFGLRDGISSIVKLQYGKVFKYTGLLVLNEEVNTIDDEFKTILEKEKITDELLVRQELFSFKTSDKKHDFYLMVPQTNKLDKFIDLRNRTTKEQYELNDDGVIITEKMAQLLGVKKGENIKIRNSDNSLFIVKVNEIVENYAYHYMYMSNNYYEKIFGTKPNYNIILFNSNNENRSQQATNLIDSGKVLNVNFTYNNIKTFDTMVSSLNKIVLVILGASCLLAFVVLYNLTTINITERIREIATIKVLGFYDKEVSSYIYKETVTLTIIGIFVGLFLGVFLHAFVMKTAEMDFIMFSKNIKFISYVLSFGITLFFSALVLLVTHFKLKKIDMIESLKSVE